MIAVEIGEEIKNAIRGKGLSMDEAAQKLGMSRATLFNKLKTADKDKPFRQLVSERLGINIDMPERNSHMAGVAERKLGDTAMKYHTVTLKKHRMAELWLPADFGKQDVETLRQWLVFVETTL